MNVGRKAFGPAGRFKLGPVGPVGSGAMVASA